MVIQAGPSFLSLVALRTASAGRRLIAFCTVFGAFGFASASVARANEVVMSERATTETAPRVAPALQLELKSGTIDTSVVSGSLWKGIRTNSKETHFFVVQFSRAIERADRLNVRTLGADIVGYIPNNALIVGATPKVARTISVSSPWVHTVLPYADDWKLSPQIGPQSRLTDSQVDRYRVLVFRGAAVRVARKLARAKGVRVLAAGSRTVDLEMARRSLGLLAGLEGVEWIEPLPRVEPLVWPVDAADRAQATANPALSGAESGTEVMRLSSAWGRGLTGAGQIVAVADTGFDQGDLASVPDDVKGRFQEGMLYGLFAKSWEDPMGHGTHVAGSVLGSGTSSGGQVRGAAWGSSLIAQSMWSPMLDNLTVPSRLEDLFSKAQVAGARIQTNSWGSPNNLGTYDSMAVQVDEYLAAHPDLLVLFAAGNSGVDGDKDGRVDPGSVSSPGTSKNALTVGASENEVATGGIQKKLSELRIGPEKFPAEPLASSKLSDNRAGIAAFSSRGPTKDGRRKPDLVAPGTNILSLRSRHVKAQPLWGPFDDNYVWSGGTSMSTPLVAGAAAVVREGLIKKAGVQNPSGALVKAVLMHTATDLYPGQFGEGGAARGQELLTRGWNSDQGAGLVNADAATDLSTALISDDVVGVATGEVMRYQVKLARSGQLRLTLVYTDAAGSPTAAKALVNDLDLEVRGSSGASLARAQDRLNNNETLVLSLASGDFEILVHGFSVPRGPQAGRQPFALIATVE
jgi:subtilisin family serine protease